MIDESLTTEKPTDVPPNATRVAPEKFVPVSVTVVPPAAGPVFGLKAVTVGAATAVNWSVEIVRLVPPAFVTVTSTVPAERAGAVAVIDVELATVKAAAVPPKLTPVGPENPVPLIVTFVPPDDGPTVGVIPVTRGAGTNPGANRRYALLPWL